MKRRILSLLAALAIMLSALCCHGAALAGPENSITFLLLGLDRDEGGPITADAIVVAALNLDTGAANLAAIDPRTAAEGGKLKDAYAKGGAPAVVQAVNALYGLQVTNFVSVDLGGMEKIIDAAGGVELDIAQSELAILLLDGQTKAFSKAGLQMLRGTQALAYMKDHTGEENGSHLSRVLSALIKKGMDMGMDPMMDLISELLVYLDTNMSVLDMMTSVFSALSVKLSGVQTMRFPVSGAAESAGKDAAVAIGDPAAESAAIQSFLYGK